MFESIRAALNGTNHVRQSLIVPTLNTKSQAKNLRKPFPLKGDTATPFPVKGDTYKEKKRHYKEKNEKKDSAHAISNPKPKAQSPFHPGTSGLQMVSKEPAAFYAQQS